MACGIQISLKIGIGMIMSQTNGYYMNVIFYSRHGKCSSLWSFTGASLEKLPLNDIAILKVICLDKLKV